MQAVSSASTLTFDPDRELAELEAYLGRRYDRRRLERHEQELEAECRRVGDERALYRSSEAYLYDLTVFAMSGAKLPYLRELARGVPPGARLLDFGCGIGSDGLCLMEAGYEVAFADFDNPSTRYLRWRLERRAWAAEIYDLDRQDPPHDFDLVYAFDVIEHVDDPFAFLERLERHGRLVLVNLLEPEPGETSLHRRLPVRDLLRRVSTRRLLSCTRYHGRSNLVLYGSERSRGVARVRSRAVLLRACMRGATSGRC